MQALTQYRPGSPLWQRHRPTTDPFDELSDHDLDTYTVSILSDEVLVPGMRPIAALCEAQNELEEIAERANAYLDCSAWGPPPWTADQWQTLKVILELANAFHPF